MSLPIVKKKVFVGMKSSSSTKYNLYYKLSTLEKKSSEGTVGSFLYKPYQSI